MPVTTADIWKWLQDVKDPEIPVLSVIELGIIREVTVTAEKVTVVITPTYSGCPAMNTIEWEIRTMLILHGCANVQIVTALSPAWTTDWMSDAGKEQLKAYGIAPPHPLQSVCNIQLFHEEEAIQCPRCASYSTRLVSRFGSTACKALYQCNHCSEPFDYFKCH